MSTPKLLGKPLTGEQQDFIRAFLGAVSAAGGTAVNVLSGYRSPAYNAQVGGAQNSNHTRGQALDALVQIGSRWVPAGDIPTLASYGLRSGDQPGFFHGVPDPNHVDVGYPGASAAPTTSLPGDLGQIISKAASAYHVPADTLAGIWAIETGRKYPNPYVNKEGYGGLFGTHNWNDPEQEQANTAAQILSRLLQESHGNMAQALSRYSGGGYTSVPGVSAGAGAASPPMAAPSVTPSASGGTSGLAPLLALIASNNNVAAQSQQQTDLPSWSNVPAPAPSLLPLLLAR